MDGLGWASFVGSGAWREIVIKTLCVVFYSVGNSKSVYSLDVSLIGFFVGLAMLIIFVSIDNLFYLIYQRI